MSSSSERLILRYLSWSTQARRHQNDFTLQHTNIARNKNKAQCYTLTCSYSECRDKKKSASITFKKGPKYLKRFQFLLFFGE